MRAPLMAVSARDGQIRSSGAQGYYLGDHRSLSRLVLTIDGHEPVMLSGLLRNANRALFVGHWAPDGSSGTTEPQFVVRRSRELTDEIREQIEIKNCDRDTWQLRVSVEIACEYADIAEVKAGTRGLPGTVHEVHDDVLGWYSYREAIDRDEHETPRTLVHTMPRADSVSVDGQADGAAAVVGRFTWNVQLKPAESWTAILTTQQPEPPKQFPFQRPRGAASWLRAPLVPRGDSSALDRLVENSLADLDALRLTTSRREEPAVPGLSEGEFAAAGAPWFLTLFGRDSLWTARMLLPIDRGLALGTLATLSRYQGDKHDGHNEERPGKIPHELRAGETNHGDTLSLPPVYYGSVDSTLLFIILMVESWRQDKDDEAIKALLPALHSALNWLEWQSADHELGFVTYQPKPGQLSHQGWKDSPEAVTFASGQPADGPIALCEVQAYAYEAAMGAADLLEYVEGPAAAARASGWREWAARLKSRFREAFWVEDAYGHYPAIALDRDSIKVDGPSSNIGHLLSGGLLDDDEAQEVIELLFADGLNSQWGVRTRSEELVSYNPFGYHCGSVWPHDTAITISGLLGRDRQRAETLARGLLDASAAFGFRLPELFAGISRKESPQPVPVRAACMPQAWASASAIVIAQALGALDDNNSRGGMRERG
ncbi:glycogen debranching N-terminal domain-containing protein [Actinocrinis sp.]|uniref:amylo-alpha-1,6-glucosidase n=1 Tax=Actinocrinis sp. TaxID=1920516 RepID=UPI002C19ECB6|nr:glycogen debranching N-terminal domain-containing protein [Actinocrinis sp.]HXR69909.1 glycogen debranching N-terminal domain-containing protein [Actinocrinis sp.]